MHLNLMRLLRNEIIRVDKTKIVIVDLINFENLYTLKLTSINKIPLKNITLNSEN